MQIGAQLYTVREHTRNLDDFSETLKKIADIGYKTVQVSGTCRIRAEMHLSRRSRLRARMARRTVATVAETSSSRQ